MATQVRIHGLEETVRRLRALPKELAGFRGGPVRKGLFEAAGVIFRDARQRAPVDPSTETDIPSAIRRRRSTNPRAEEGSPVELYRVGVDVKKAYYWKFLEFGTAKQPAQSFMRTAFDSKKEEAVEVFAKELKKAVEKAERTVL